MGTYSAHRPLQQLIRPCPPVLLAGMDFDIGEGKVEPLEQLLSTKEEVTRLG